MYLITLEMLEELTLNAPYPSCQAKYRPCSPIHFEELDLIKVIALARANVGGKRKSRCTWSGMPPTAKGSMSWFLQMPVMYGQSRSCILLEMSLSRFLVLKTRWM